MIVFLCTYEGGLSQIIVNVETQKGWGEGISDIEPGNLLCEAFDFFAEGRNFENFSYDGIKRVYSILMCMNMEENVMNHIHRINENVSGFYEWKGKQDMLNIVMIDLVEEVPGHDKRYELHRLLGALLSQELTIDEKLNIIGNEHDIPIAKIFRKDVSVMCNLNQGSEGKGIAIGEVRREAKIILSMYNNGFIAGSDGGNYR